MKIYMYVLISIFFFSCKNEVKNDSNKILDELRRQYVLLQNEDTLNDFILKKYTKQFLNLSSNEKAAFYLCQSMYYRRHLENIDSSILYAKKSVLLCKTDLQKNYKTNITVLQVLINDFFTIREIDSALKYAYQAIDLSEKFNYKKNYSYYNLSTACYSAEDYEGYKKYSYKSLKINKDSSLTAAIYNNLSVYYEQKKQFDSVKICITKAIQINTNLHLPASLGENYTNLSSYFLNINQPDSSKYYLLKAIEINKNYTTERPADSELLGDLYTKLNDEKNAIKAYDDAIIMGENLNMKKDIISPCKKNYAIYQKNGNYKLANDYLLKSLSVSEKYYTEALVEKSKSLEKDFNLKLKDEQIKNLTFQKKIHEQDSKIKNWILVIIILIILFIGFVIYFYYRSQKLKQEMERSQLEQRILRTQMEPHFIFNTLSVMQSFIRQDEKEKALKYIKQFAKLLRAVLQNSRENWVLLSEEMDALSNYLSLQQMRFNTLFDYEIKFHDNLSDAEILIPPMLIQPFVENAIMHGFKNINYKGVLIIELYKNKNSIRCVISDNGVGFTETQIKKEYISLSTKITKERLEILSGKSSTNEFYLNYSDNPDGLGIQVEICLPFK